MTREEINTMKYKRGTVSCEAEQWAKSKTERSKE